MNLPNAGTVKHFGLTPLVGPFKINRKASSWLGMSIGSG